VTDTRYVKSGDVAIAYRVAGTEEPVLIFVPGAISNMALDESLPLFARFGERLGRFCRVVRFDKRGTGLSDRGTDALGIADQVPDVEAVRGDVGAGRVALLGLSQGAAVAVLYALEHPERVSHLILFEGLVCDRLDPYAAPECSEPLTNWGEFFGRLDDDFADFSRRLARTCFPDAPDVAEAGTEMADFLRATASPATFKALWQGIVGLDLRPRLADLRVPTLVLHARGDRHHPASHGRYLGEHIPGARYVELDSNSHIPFFEEEAAGQILTAIEAFVTGSVVHTAARRFATVVFTDIVDSTAEQKRHGDTAWKGLLETYHADAQRIIAQFGGRLVEVLGDGVLAEFPVPGEALRATRLLGEAARSHGLRIRAGLHAGEVFDVGERLLGICVNTASRVTDRAAESEILTTDVVRGLVEGSGFRFEEAGEFELKGIGARRLVRLV
jgi:pimeloyl-ACP methyl ester carboxylesterase/class 3 adenylate cyclase